MADPATPPRSWLQRAWRAFGPTPSSPLPDPRATRFRVLYERFREILILNDATLQLIADLEDALSGRTRFAHDVMHRRLRKAALDVFVMVKNLNQITDGKHAELYEAIRRVNALLEQALPAVQQTVTGPVTIHLADLRVTDAPLVGLKMAVLGELTSIVHVPVPDAFVVTASAFDTFMGDNELWEKAGRLETIFEAHGAESLASACSEVQSAILCATVPLPIRDEILDRFDALAAGQPTLVAMRSSAIGEDADSSHAGQYHTELLVDRGRLLDAWRSVLASAYSPGAVAYRFERGLPSSEARMAVGCMRMVAARCSGILFSRAFQSPDEDTIVISATRGLAAGLASGEQVAEEIVVRDHLSSAMREGCLAPEEIQALARIARELEHYFGKPQDIEWAIDASGILFVLQSRAMVVTRPQPSPAPHVGDLARAIASGGLVACPGAASGPVALVASDVDIDRIAKGAVLVAHHSSPAFSRAMQRCAAIVTEVGSPTGHMAILAREFDVPAIVGLPGIMARLSQDQTITVDATSCCIFDGLLPLPQADRAGRPPKPEGPPVIALRKSAELVTPLHLTDPLSIEFAPQRCRSLHDITRYVHEKVFEVMFHVGDIAESDRQGVLWLDAHLPIRVALYDLGGGLAPSAARRERAVLADVASTPARAFLDGLTDARIRWDQPRPVSPRGFLSVLGEGIAGPPPEAQQVGRTSYAVLSDRYMNFSTKAGYHFSTVDAWCGESLNKNYIHFRFERGGASSERRQRRVRFLDSVMSTIGFATRVREDTVVARLQKYPREVIADRLADLGRLTLVSRQLDMLMDTDASAEHFARAFLAGRFDLF
jgi:pyruvate, water dikinase